MINIFDKLIGKRSGIIYIFLFIVVAIFGGCKTRPEFLPETDIVKINLKGIAAERFIEASGLAWYEDYLIILPQFPHKVCNEADGALLYIKKQDIIDYLNGDKTDSLAAEKLLFSAAGLDSLGKREGSGYEAIAFDGRDVFVQLESFYSIEYSSYLYSGKVVGDFDSVVIDSSTRIPIKSKTGLKNTGEESIFFQNGNITCIHEANGSKNSKNHFAARYNKNDGSLKKIDFPQIEYRITDASEVDENGNFWVINYYYPGDSLLLTPAVDYYSSKFGLGKSHTQFKPVERLLLLHSGNKDISYTNLPPIYINLHNNKGRNWEGLVKLEDKGFLIITDYYPSTLLAFVPFRDD